MAQIAFGVAWIVATGTALAQSCDEAWAQYNEFKKNNVMESSEYARTTYGAQVRAACGASALPVPPGTDTPHRVISRTRPKPSAPNSPRPPRPMN
jgi:hypothetical protein